MCFQEMIRQAWKYGVDEVRMMEFYTSFDASCTCRWFHNRLQDFENKSMLQSSSDIAVSSGSSKSQERKARKARVVSTIAQEEGK